MRLRDLDGDALARADELLGRAAHDVAKYMAITARNVDAAAADQAAADLLRRDLTQTDGRKPAWEIWKGVSESLADLADDEGLRAVDEAMARLSTLVAEREGDLGTLARLAVEVADRIVELKRAVRRRLVEAGR